MIHRAFIATALIAAAASLAAQDKPATPPAAADGGNDIMKKAINVPGANWSFYGPATSKGVKVTGVPGNQAVQVTVPAKGANVWDVGGISPIQKAIAANDTILVAAWIRDPQLKDGETTTIKNFGATQAAEPYASIAAIDVAVTREWKLYYASGKAPQAFPAGTARVSVHLAAEKHVVELGPVFVLDFGPGQDPAKLPHN